MKIGTKVIRAGLAPTVQGEPLLAGVTFAGTSHASGDTSDSPYTYGRYHNPTRTQFERALSELEGGVAVSFALGMAAEAAVFGTTLGAGDLLVMPSNCYWVASSNLKTKLQAEAKTSVAIERRATASLAERELFFRSPPRLRGSGAG